jgi:nucleoside-diphosphate-sugar epimerase
MFGEEPLASVRNHPNLELVKGDFRQVDKVVQAMQGVEAVVHLGGIVGDPACSLDEALTIDVNLSATKMIADLAKSHGVTRFVFASTCSVYGASPRMLDERSEVRPLGIYGHTKYASEKVLLDMASTSFTPTILRFATIYGLSGRTRFDLVVNLLTAKAKLDGEITVHNGNQWRPFVHVDDAARSVVAVLEAPLATVANEIFNVGSSDQNFTITQVGELIQQQVIAAKLITSEEDKDRRDYRVDFSKIRNLLDFQTTWTVEEGIQQVLEAIASGRVVNYRDPQYSNVAFLSQEGTAGLARDRWARELIEDLTNQS